MPSWFPRTLPELAAFVPLRVAFLVLAALVARAVLHHLVNTMVRRSVGSPPARTSRASQVFVEAAGLPTDRRQQRIMALASLARSAITLGVFVLAGMMILSELGFDVTSIVAGTSVLAVTLGFGVQTIVRDLISGIFLLVEDQLGVGDWVDMEKASGEVEAIGLRVTQLRDDDGTRWYVRNGEVLRVGNFSQGGPGRPPEPAVEAPA